MTTNARTIATAARGAVIIGSGLALGFMTAHVAAQAVDNATAAPTKQAGNNAGKQSQQQSGNGAAAGSGPGIVYRNKAAANGGASLNPAPQAPQSAPAAKQPAAKTKAS